MSAKPVFSRAVLPGAGMGVVGRSTGSESRSTSAGTHSNSPGDPTASFGLPDVDYPAPFNLSKLPDTTYPSPFVIKNTFIDAKAQPSFDSLADFLEDRKTRSCPVSRILSDEHDSWRISQAAVADGEALMAAAAEALLQCAEDVEADARYPENHDFFDTASTFGVCEPPPRWDSHECISDESVGNNPIFDTASTFEALDIGERSREDVLGIGAFQESDSPRDAVLESPSSWPCHADFAVAEEALASYTFEQADSQRAYIKTVLRLATQEMPPPAPLQPPVLDASQRPLPAPPPPEGPPPSAAPVLLLAEALPASESRIEGFPSVGSQCHSLGTCQPCAFFHTQGCQNSLSCQFCHLCGPGEKKKRLREKRAARREWKLSGFLLAAGAV